MLFRVRIDEVNSTSREALTQWCAKNSSEYVVMHHHVHMNKHYHLYLDSPMVMSPQSLRYKLKSHFNLESTQYSVGVCDKSRIAEYLSYLYNTKHGNIATLLATTLDDSTMEEAKQNAGQISETYRQERAKNPKPISLYDIAKEVNELCGHDCSRTDIVMNAIRLLHKYCKCHDSYLVRKVVETVLSMKDPESFAKYCLTSMT